LRVLQHGVLLLHPSWDWANPELIPELLDCLCGESVGGLVPDL